MSPEVSPEVSLEASTPEGPPTWLPRWLIVARSNQYGLTSDAGLLAEAIREVGGTVGYAPVRSRHFLDWLFRRKRANTIVHLERAFPRWFSGGRQNWLIPNQERFPERHVRRLRQIDLVLAKTRHAEAIFSARGVPTTYLGFTSRDRRDEGVTRQWNRVFHLAGGSTLKGTDDVLAAWSAHPEWPELVLVQKAGNAPKSVPANVRLVSGYLDDAELRRLQNQCGVHLCPSRAEGWGHNIVEALSVGAVVIATDAAPMNELIDASCGVPVTVARSEPRHLGISHFVARDALEAAIEGVIAMTGDEKRALGNAARRRFESIDRDFRIRVNRTFGTAANAP